MEEEPEGEELQSRVEGELGVARAKACSGIVTGDYRVGSARVCFMTPNLHLPALV